MNPVVDVDPAVVVVEVTVAFLFGSVVTVVVDPIFGVVVTVVVSPFSSYFF